MLPLVNPVRLQPDLPLRLLKDIPLAKWDPTVFYTPEEACGYIDYPFAANDVPAQ